MRSALAAALLTVGTMACSSPAADQTPQPAAPPKDVQKPVSKLPDGWKVRLDEPDGKEPGTVQVEKDAIVMAGGPGGIFYKADAKAEKDYTVIAALTQSKTLPAPQAYGLFVSGMDLDKDTWRYTAFVVRQDGKYRIVTRSAGKETVLVPWRTASAMLEPKGVKPTNTLEVRAMQGAVHFLIGDKEVHQMPREKVGPDGIAGIRLGPGMNVQVTKLEVKKFP
jgi:hypothetical protein